MNKRGDITIWIILITIALIIYVSLQSYTVPFDYDTNGGTWYPVCGNDICEAGAGIDEFISCPEDCGIICGDGECVTSPYDERIYCPQDCEIEPSDIQPLVGGMKFETPSGGVCTIGMIVKQNNQDYILTAGHCITIGSDGMPDKPDDIGLAVRKNGQIIGYVYDFDDSGGIDSSLISIKEGIGSAKII